MFPKTLIRIFFLCGEPTPGVCSSFLDTFFICHIQFYTNASAYMGLYICHKYTTISALIIRCIEKESILKSPVLRGGAFGNGHCATNRKFADSIAAVLTLGSIQPLTEINNSVIFWVKTAGAWG
jgi:hypothetical protein